MSDVAANDSTDLQEICRKAWADRCGIDYNDDRVVEPHLYGWPEKYALFRDGFDHACMVLTRDLTAARAERDAKDAQLTSCYAKLESALAELEAARKLLLRLRQWDMMDTTADGPYWKHEIDAAMRQEKASG